MRLGSLCTGVGGLDLAVKAVTGAELAWCAEIDPAASRVLAHRFPGVPNFGDFRGQTPDPVDVLCAGFPCQPVSTAGRRQGTDDDRWLFDDIADLVGRMASRPRLLVFENVLGLLSANDGDAMGRVVHRLARLGYMGRWGVVRASDAGAPHQRARVFIVAADADSGGFARLEEQHGDPTTGLDRASGRHAARRDVEGDRGRLHGPPIGVAVDADGAARRQPWNASEAVHEPGTVERPGRCDRVAWGPYEPAIRRWEHILGRPAPNPVDDRGRLNPWLVEWMMGLPEGWVCDVATRRTDALRMLGNGVVPQQAALALRMLGVGEP